MCQKKERTEEKSTPEQNSLDNTGLKYLVGVESRKTKDKMMGNIYVPREEIFLILLIKPPHCFVPQNSVHFSHCQDSVAHTRNFFLTADNETNQNSQPELNTNYNITLLPCQDNDNDFGLQKAE